MELYAFDRELPMAHPHDLAVVGRRGDLELRRARAPRSIASEW